MTVRIRTPPRAAQPRAAQPRVSGPRVSKPRASLAACLGVAGLVLVAGCGTAPAGAAGDSPAIGPVRAMSATNFAPFAVPTVWDGYNNVQYTMVLKAVTGARPREFHITVGSDMMFWLSCIGTGTAMVISEDMGLNWGVACGTGDDPSGIDFRPRGAVVGSKVKVLVTAPPGARWEIRIDAPVSSLAASGAAPTTTATASAS
jgi:hypothetical protein